MSRSLRIALIGALLLPSSAAFAAAPEVSQVSIEEFQVDGAPRLLHLVGKNFTNSTTVTIGGLNANIVDWSADILSVAIPVPYYGDFEVAVTNTTVAKKGPNGTVVETYRFMWTYAALEGVPGPQGPIGPEGPMGPAGPQGATGATGPQGDQGLMGPQGLKGDKGDQGDVGPQGDQGLMGPQGLKGDKGDQGDVGPQGDKGDKGDTGEQGLQGPPGQGSGIHAVVASDGSLVVARSNGIADSVKLGKGSYVLTFSRDVSACAWLASAAGNASVSTAEVSGVGEQVGITTLGVNGKAEDSGFTMIVSCPPAN